MSMRDEFSDTQLHAFIDGQLHGRDRERLLAAMESDPALAERICALQRTKAWVNLAFEDARAPQHPLPRTSGGRWIRIFGLAASLLLLASGFLLGWLTATSPEPLQSVVLRDIEAGHQKVLLHIDRADPERFDEILDGAEHLLRAYRDQGIAVDVLANAGGVDMLRADISPYAERVARMLREYDNLQFVVCANTLQRLKEKGVTPVLIEHTRQDATAVGHIIRRLQQGWTYIRV
ncbi:MAG: hypothetical protein LOY58_12915 [Gammaproteobacteria bacterium]|nr:hypothetical protein [Gammaproteobacteria bacterium]